MAAISYVICPPLTSGERSLRYARRRTGGSIDLLCTPALQTVDLEVPSLGLALNFSRCLIYLIVCCLVPLDKPSLRFI